jgi:hypothetical protein
MIPGLTSLGVTYPGRMAAVDRAVRRFGRGTALW